MGLFPQDHLESVPRPNQLDQATYLADEPITRFCTGAK